jgi:hypothetical protein
MFGQVRGPFGLTTAPGCDRVSPTVVERVWHHSGIEKGTEEGSSAISSRPGARRRRRAAGANARPPHRRARQPARPRASPDPGLGADYTVVMSHPVSVRFHDPLVADQLKAEAIARSASTSSLAEELIDEGLRTRRHPLVSFRDGPAGRRAHLVGGPDVWEVVEGLIGGDVPVAERITRAVEVFGLPGQLVEAALAYYAEFTEEIDGQVGANRKAAEEAEAQWRRRQDLLAG